MKEVRKFGGYEVTIVTKVKIIRIRGENKNRLHIFEKDILKGENDYIHEMIDMHDRAVLIYQRN
jgi:hypothetical protein